VETAPTFDERGVRWIYFAKDAWAAVELARRGEIGAREFAAPYVGPGKVRAILAGDDPLPAVASLAYLRTKVV
jgi:predicted ATP-grasp superfamily ATP-dependent carboligase